MSTYTWMNATKHKYIFMICVKEPKAYEAYTTTH